LLSLLSHFLTSLVQISPTGTAPSGEIRGIDGKLKGRIGGSLIEPRGFLAKPTPEVINFIKEKASTPIAAAIAAVQVRTATTGTNTNTNPTTNPTTDTQQSSSSQTATFPSPLSLSLTSEPVPVDLKATPPEHVISIEEATGISSGFFGAALGNYIPDGIYKALDYPNYECWSPATG
jgi:hypothetical protein